MESAEDATATIDELIALHEANVVAITNLGRATKNALLVFNYLESNPIIEIRKTAEALGIAFNTTSSAVNRLVDAGILVQTSDNNRNRTFAYEAYLDILRKET
ncbi:MAG: winged helix-turn-helix domain-containing protein [Succinivibrionaceae bacterium]|nr:winged helix-turn-helix domain-containing protein [Succinivibrionaceae bacterium]